MAQKRCELVVRHLEAQGVSHVFGVPGAKIDRVCDALVGFQEESKYGRRSWVEFGPIDTVRFMKNMESRLRRRVAERGLPARDRAKAMELPGPVLIDVPVDYSHNKALGQQVLPQAAVEGAAVPSLIACEISETSLERTLRRPGELLRRTLTHRHVCPRRLWRSSMRPLSTLGEQIAAR